MTPVILLSMLNLTGLYSSIQPIQVQTYPEITVPPPLCGAFLFPYETSFSMWNSVYPQMVCRTPGLAYTRWTGSDWTRPVNLSGLSGGSLKTAADQSGNWWVSIVSSSGPTAGGNGASRSLIVDGTTLSPRLNTTSINVQDIQWASGSVYVMGSTSASSTGGPSLFSAGIGMLEVARGSVVWLPGTMRSLSLQAFVAPQTPTGPLYMVPFGTPLVLEQWNLNRTSGLWGVTSRVPLSTTLQVMDLILQDGTIWVLTTQTLLSIDASGKVTEVTRVRPGLTFISAISTTVQIATGSATLSASASSTPSVSPSNTPSVSPSNTPSASATTLGGSVSQTSTPSPTPSTSIGVFTSETPSPTGTGSVTPTPTISSGVPVTITSTVSVTPTSNSTGGSAMTTGSDGLSPGAQAGIGIGVLASVGLAGIAANALYQHYRRPARYFRRPKGVPKWNQLVTTVNHLEILKSIEEARLNQDLSRTPPAKIKTEFPPVHTAPVPIGTSV